jgi:hypothetical protein
MSSTNILDLTPKMRDLYITFNQKMMEKKIPFMITRVACNLTEQMALYVKGRLPLEEVNRFMSAVKFPLISRTDNNVVTWTLNSKHIITPDNPFSRAFDIAILKGGNPTWDIKVDVNLDEIPDYKEAAEIGESIGLVSGGSYGDWPHLEEPK